MVTIKIELPPALLQRLRNEATSDQTTSQLIVDAIQMWLEKRKKKTTDMWELLEECAGKVEAPEDWSLEHDHYLYGNTKHDNRQA